MPVVIVDGQEIQLDAAERLNGIQAARRAGVEVPHYCWHPGLTVVASCRMCLVETGRRDPETGKTSMVPKLVPACQTPATDGTVFVTNSEKVIAARAMVEEDLLLRHPIDCPICDKAGECQLQDYHFHYGREQRRADIKPFTSRRRSLGDTVTLFVDRCVMCSRCVRFCREIAGTSELMIINRGSREEIDVFPGFPLANKLSGNVVDLCPVGALGDKDFLYSQRVWFMRREAGVCAGCSTGCSIYIEQNQDRIYRLKPRENPHINGWWMCDEGRYGWKHVHDPARLTVPRARNGDTSEPRDWHRLLPELDQAVRRAGSLTMVLSPFLTVEEAYLAASYARGIDPQAVLVRGHIPSRGSDERFPGGFTIRAEKCPNRRGVEEVLAGVGGARATWEEWLGGRGAAHSGCVWLTGGYPEPLDGAGSDALADVPLLIVQELLPSPWSSHADYQLPAAAFAEREGSYVQQADRCQSFTWAIRPPAGVLSDGQLFWRLLERPGLFDSRQVMSEIASAIPYFAAAATPVPDNGAELRAAPLVPAG